MKDFLKKYGSRKFLLALTSVVAGILTLANCDNNLIEFIVSLIMIIVPAILYIVTEGILDYKSIGLALREVLDAVDKYIESKETKEETEPTNENLQDDNKTDDVAELQEGEIIISEDGIAM